VIQHISMTSVHTWKGAISNIVRGDGIGMIEVGRRCCTGVGTLEEFT
jgi:hypothetical protein